MSDEHRPGVRREDLPDEMPRSTTSDDRFRPARRPIPRLIWILLGLLVALVFAVALGLVGPETPGIGQSGADIVSPQAPPIRKP